MNLDEIVNKAIPILASDCRIRRAQKEERRKLLKERIDNYASYYHTTMAEQSKIPHITGIVQGGLVIVGDIGDKLK